MPPLIRRRSFLERIKSYLNPLDFLLWLSEEIDSSDWEQWEKEWALPVGVALNVLFLVARANTSSISRIDDDIFSEQSSKGLLAWLASFIVHLLALLSASNALYTFGRTRPYRLFEVPIDDTPSTPSARRVQVNSSPLASSPLRFLTSAFTIGSAETRSHPDAERDVWQVSVWDPHPLAIRLFCLFSPGHVLVYWLFLPTASTDPRPSMTIITTLFLAALLTFQMSALSASYSQQSKDSALVQKEVLNEYDTKYVRPRTQILMRNVSTQFCEADSYVPHKDEKFNKVETYAPAIMQHGFRVSPNPNYICHLEADYLQKRSQLTPRHSITTPRVTSTGSVHASDSVQPSAYSADVSSPRLSQGGPIRQLQFRSNPTATGDGGNLGVYSHAQSPLRKSASSHFERRHGVIHRDADTLQSPRRFPSSPLKRSSLVNDTGRASDVHVLNRSANVARGIRRESDRF
ncbi:hypothetical protein FQN57_001122 [Myotisia sp. PD_48]|nr:hypothetical protein FQN57_001122 [Myotisia sp. PD_48]